MALVSLRGEKEFRKVRAHGQPVRSPLLTVRLTEYRPRYGERWQPRALVGIVVSKKTLKRAVDRNRVRRRVREALRTLPGGLPPCRAIVLPNPAALTVPFEELQLVLARAFAAAPGRVRGGKNRTGNQKRPERVPEAMPSSQTTSAQATCPPEEGGA